MPRGIKTSTSHRHAGNAIDAHHINIICPFLFGNNHNQVPLLDVVAFKIPFKIFDFSFQKGDLTFDFFFALHEGNIPPFRKSAREKIKEKGDSL